MQLDGQPQAVEFLPSSLKVKGQILVRLWMRCSSGRLILSDCNGLSVINGQQPVKPQSVQRLPKVVQGNLLIHDVSFVIIE